MHKCFSLDIICSSKNTVFLEVRFRENARSEHIMSVDKYQCIFLRQTEIIVYVFGQTIASLGLKSVCTVINIDSLFFLFVFRVFGLGNLWHIIPGSFGNLTNLQYL